jgi:2-polyprenyl-6-methoxyphenol hydroxylase-like FAD-dependent oxidoreductase
MARTGLAGCACKTDTLDQHTIKGPNFMRIAIIGAGMGGLTAASLLADQGHDITIFDQFDTPKPVGSGLVIQPVGHQVLAEVCALETALSYGNRVTHMLGIEAQNGKRMLDVRYDLVDPTTYGLAIHRAALFDALWQAMKTRDGITLVTSADITSVRQDDDTIDVFTASHDAFGPFDLCIDSAGAGSPLSPLTSKPLGYGAIWGTVDWPNDTDLPKHHLSQRYVAASHMIGALPIGTLPGDTSFKAAIFWSLPSGGYDAWKSNGLDAWRAEAKTLWPALAPFVDQITDADQMTMARYSHGTLNRPYTNRLVHIGDAAHRASPQLGQGANMALLDALALSRALATRTIGQALPAYARAPPSHKNLSSDVLGLHADVSIRQQDTSDPARSRLVSRVANPTNTAHPDKPCLRHHGLTTQTPLTRLGVFWGSAPLSTAPRTVIKKGHQSAAPFVSKYRAAKPLRLLTFKRLNACQKGCVLFASLLRHHAHGLKFFASDKITIRQPAVHHR